MNKIATNSSVAEKEMIARLEFPKNEVLRNEAEVMARKSNIKQAIRLGNIEKYKVKIIFEDNISIRKVHTTISGVNNNDVILKKGVVIPIYRIYQIKFY